MSWSPTTTVTVAGVDFTGDTIGQVSITRGRDTVYADPTAGYATVTLIDKTGAGFDIDPTVTLRIAVNDSTSTAVPMFTGTVTDIDRELYDPGLTGSPASVVRLTAVGPLARLARRQVLAGGRPAEKDGDRIAAAIAAGLAQTWQEAQGTWDDQDATWATVDPLYDPALIDAGLFDLVALPAQDGGHNALQTAQQASSSGQGILYETADGPIGWANADSRGLNPTYLDISGDQLLASSLRSSTSLSDIVNAAEVTHATGAATAIDLDSVGLYDRYDRRIPTLLTDAGNAQTYADQYVARHAYPLINLDRVSIRLDGLDDADADALLTIAINQPVYLTGLPDTLRINALPGFVEGLAWRIDPYRAELTLTVSDAQLSIGDARWSQVPAGLLWQDVSATLEWQDARSL